LHRKLYLHVGPAKTASSAIQHTLGRRHNSFVIYPKVGLWAGAAHHNLVYNYFGRMPDKQGAAKANIDELFAAIGKEAQQTSQNVLISSETLVQGGRNISAFVQALMGYLGNSRFEVEIILMIREHFERSASYYSQYLRGRERRDPDTFLLQNTHLVCYEAMVRELLALGYRVTGLNYHPANGCVHRFLVHVGFPQHAMPRVKDINMSLSPKALIARLAMNRSGAPDRIGAAEALLAAMPGNRRPSQFIFGPEAFSKAERIFARDRKFIRNTFGIELLPPPPEARSNTFQIDTADLDDIAGAVRTLGPKADEIVEVARQYLRAR
jgi:hypothetical protein